MALFQMDFISQSLKRSVPVNVLIPADPKVGYPPREEKPFKTLYLLHGLNGDHTGWLTQANTTAYAQLYDLAIVMPSGECSFYLDHERSGLMYSQFIGSEIVDFTRRIFPLSRKREDTLIGGLSMGGFGALYNGLRYHDVFGAIIALSSAILVRHMETAPSGSGARGADISFYEAVAGGGVD
ncbi:MAG: acetylesterase, partial [Peptococcaceae bacterium]|nr:acetylesterase [Peptococcaceae bacterium]